MVTSPTWMDSLLSRLGSGWMLGLFLGTIAGSTVIFLLNFESLLKQGRFGSLIAVILAAAMAVSAVRGMCTASGTNPGAATIASLFLMFGLAAVATLARRDDLMRVMLGGISIVLLLVAAVYSWHHVRHQSQGGVAS